MKLIHVSSRVSFLALAALGVATPSRPIAQTIQFYGVEKRITYSQTSSAAPSSPATTINDPSGPYFFEGSVSGSNLNLLTPAPTLSGAFSGALVLKSNDEYGFTAGLPAAHSFNIKSDLDTAFPNGTYSLNGLPLTTPPGIGSVSLNLGIADAYPAAIPYITNGTWSGSALQVNAVTGMTLNFSPFAAYGTGGGSLIEFHLYSTNLGAIGSDLDSVVTISVFSNAAQTSYTFAPGQLTAGQTYFAELSYGTFTNTNQAAISGALGYALYQDMTGFSISAIPEPSTYAAVTGVLALGLVCWRRRFATGRA
jgi:hypothetical protein